LRQQAIEQTMTDMTEDGLCIQELVFGVLKDQ